MAAIEIDNFLYNFNLSAKKRSKNILWDIFMVEKLIHGNGESFEIQDGFQN